MKRPKASTVPDQEAGTGADVGCMFAHFGIPAELHTNQNRNLGVTQRRLSFTGKAKGWCNTMNIPSPHSWCGCHNCLVTLSAMVRGIEHDAFVTCYSPLLYWSEPIGWLFICQRLTSVCSPARKAGTIKCYWFSRPVSPQCGSPQSSQ